MELFGNKNLSYSIHVDSIETYFLAMQLAATILYELDTHYYIDKSYEKSYHFTGKHLESVSEICCDTAYVNFFQRQVELLYTIVKGLLDLDEFRFHISRNAALLITKALSRYQEFKENIVKEEKIRNNSKTWGDATGFNKMDWSDLNSRILELYNK